MAFEAKENSPWRLLFALLLAIAMVAKGALAATSISTDGECGSCLAGGQISCRSTAYDRAGYCCDVTEKGSRSCGGRNAFCSDDALNPAMQTFSCPYTSNYCGASVSELTMHPSDRNNLRIEIQNSLYVQEETCYYVFSVP